ncbi:MULTISPECIES: phosphoribosylformylglycinamidine cyclo-ligase [Anoxybacillus]|uniref:Phosphoribosylformylglycinamidine cyclo-ligase n=1 Tax=Anoxybacillus flavithermus TaxID=33934 RepID=A0A178T4I8_9BACL|nr:phosphoribosylformylglycinamidine cyclo-ligase [Anoxybacillus flavithermus]ASA97989.1 phosphoribosylformylglycinamidine cyclo-ligase [Anoxybacillus flavithermus]ELK23070.1 phosphoribosylformylglycinamidine cyclo-ligase [Anoxybacillus flavithermus TNO-09.006]MBE2905418.1 phosphoribosylformylglycinamidine cyclo-ligase [Anoxybacillus flavithermus]MBE2908094.1 phosphoribosylformylglycinamidine cyclo-ligase [Anoxybacillus flavithermus]MBE2911030.1 phosphoribosylformylglycinamidine cyclo-ligase [
MAHVYKQAGVNIEAGYEAVERMKKHVAKTARIGALGSLGGFGGMFDLSSLGYKQPVLVSGTDGVGTKLMLAFAFDRHDTIGIDCVAMCVNDIVVQGAEPLFFLDYIACGKAVPEKIEHIVKGMADGCVEAGCALIGGETAEMPGMYGEDEYDVAGFAVGVVEKTKVVTGDTIVPGDVLIGLASSGLHSNGYSLVRKIIKDADLRLDDIYEPFSRSLGEELLTPTRIYVRAVLEALKQFRVKGMAHITGGGFIENIPRMLPKGLQAEIDYGSWPIPPIFNFLQQHGQLQRTEMFNIFNMGIGFVLAVDSDVVPDVVQLLESCGEEAYIIGRVKEGVGVSFAGGKIE